jgi:ABC-type transport system involved in multi-copper enzyme maturation permease subunit
MVRADLLKVRKRLGTTIWSLVLIILPLVIYFAVRAAQHSSNPHRYAPAGGSSSLADLLRLLALSLGPLAAILIGTDAGAGDSAAGVFRDLVATGRERLALFASRVPAAIAYTWLLASLGYAVVAIGVYALASGAATPSATLMLEGYGFTLLSLGVICAAAVGFASLVTSRPAAITVLIGWQLVASPIIGSISSLGSARKLLLSEAIAQFSPVSLVGKHGGATVTMSLATALAVMIVWLLLLLGLGAWRTRTLDA